MPLKNKAKDRFYYPSLWAAIDKLIDFTEIYCAAYERLKAGGYTTDDAFALKCYKDKITQSNSK